MGAGALRPRVLAAHNAAMEDAAGAGAGLRVSAASDAADSSVADSSRDASPTGRTSRKRASQSQCRLSKRHGHRLRPVRASTAARDIPFLSAI